MRKIIVLLSMMILVSSLAFGITPYPDSNPFGATYGYHFDESSGTNIPDFIDSQDMTRTGGSDSFWAASFIPDFNNSGDYVAATKTDTASFAQANTANYSISLWIEIDAIDKAIVNRFDAGSATRQWSLEYGTAAPTNEFRLNVCDDGAGGVCNAVFSSGFNGLSGKIVHLVVTINEKAVRFYLNGTNINNATLTTEADNSLTPPLRAGQNSGGNTFAGELDDLLFFDGTVLTPTQVETIFSGNYTVEEVLPVITFIDPTVQDGARNNTQVEITASCNVNNNTFLYFDSNNPPLTLVQDDVATNTTYNTNVTVDDTYYYTANCGGVNTSIRSWVYDTTQPSITIGGTNSFSSDNETANPFSDFLNLSITTEDTAGLFAFQVNVSLNGTEYFSYTNESLNNATSFTFTQDVNTDGFPNGDYQVKVFSSDTHTARQIPHYNTQIIGNKIFYDTVEGNTITIESQAATIPTTTKEFDRYTFTFDFQNPSPTKIFFVECDNDLHYYPDSEFPAHFVCFNWETRSGNWIDFLIEGEEDLVPSVMEAGANRYKVTYTTNSDVLTFKSIGGLNINELDFVWQHSNLSIQSLRIDPSNQATKDDDLDAYATGFEGIGRDIGYQWLWYRNGSIFKTGAYGNFNFTQSEFLYNEVHTNADGGAEWDGQVGGSCNGAIELTQDADWTTACTLDGDGFGSDDKVVFNESYDTTNATSVHYKFRVGTSSSDSACSSFVTIRCIEHETDTKQQLFQGRCLNNLGFIDFADCVTTNYTVNVPQSCLTDRPIIQVELDTISSSPSCTAGDTHNVLFYEGELITNNTGSDSPSETEVLLDTVDDSLTSVGDVYTFASRSVFNPTSNYSNSTTTSIQDIVVNSCSATIPFPVLNMTYFNELTNVSITADNGVEFTFTDDIRDYNVTVAFSGNTNDAICTNLNSSIIQHNWTMTGGLTLSSSGFATRQYSYNTPNQLEVSNDPTENLPLFLIPLNGSTTVTFTWLSTNFEPLTGTMRVFKCNDDGTRTLVESPLIIDSIANANIELLNQRYFYDIIVDGTVYQDTTSFSQCHLESQTAITYQVNIDAVDLSPTVGMYAIGCNITKTGNDTVKMEWGTNPRSSSAITGCIYASRLSNAVSSQFYTNCTSSAFSIERTIPSASGFNYMISGKLFQTVDSTPLSIACENQVEFNFDTTTSNSFGLLGIISIIFLIAAMLLMFSNESPGYQPWAAAGAVVIAWLTGLTPFGWVPISSLIAFVLIIGWIGRHTRHGT